MTTSKQPTKQTYSQIILRHLLAGKRLSNLEAYNQYGMTCFLQRISDLRAAGVVIQDEMVQRNGKRFKQYWIDQPISNNNKGATSEAV